jgi:hypothetical protein
MNEEEKKHFRHMDYGLYFFIGLPVAVIIAGLVASIAAFFQ